MNQPHTLLITNLFEHKKKQANFRANSPAACADDGGASSNRSDSRIHTHEEYKYYSLLSGHNTTGTPLSVQRMQMLTSMHITVTQTSQSRRAHCGDTQPGRYQPTDRPTDQHNVHDSDTIRHSAVLSCVIFQSTRAPQTRATRTCHRITLVNIDSHMHACTLHRTLTRSAHVCRVGVAQGPILRHINRNRPPRWEEERCAQRTNEKRTHERCTCGAGTQHPSTHAKPT